MILSKITILLKYKVLVIRVEKFILKPLQVLNLKELEVKENLLK
jgi:hypothetical protein